MRLRPLALGTLLTVGVCSTAAAQQPQAPGPGSEREFEIGLRASSHYETNVAHTSAAVAAARGIERNDLNFRPSASISLSQPLGRQVVFLEGNVGYDFYQRNKQLERHRYDISGGVSGALGPCGAVLFGSFNSSQSDLADLEVGQVRNTISGNTVGTSLSCGRPIGLNGGVVLSRSETTNSAPLRKISNSDQQLVSVNIGYRHPSLGSVSAFFARTDADQPNRIIVGRPIGDGFFTEALGVSVERQVGSRLVGSASFARNTLKREFAPPGIRQSVTSTTYSGNLSYAIGTRIDVNLAAQRLVQPSQRVGKVYDIVTGGEVSVSYKLGSRFTVRAGHSIRKVKSNVDTTTPIPVVTDSLANASFASFSFDALQRVSLTADVRHEDRETDVPAFDYNSTRLGLTVAARF